MVWDDMGHDVSFFRQGFVSSTKKEPRMEGANHQGANHQLQQLHSRELAYPTNRNEMANSNF